MKIVKSLDFWIAVVMLLMGGTLAFVAVGQDDLGARVVASVVAGFMAVMGSVFLVAYLRLDSRLYLWGNKKPMGEREAYWSLMVLPWLFIGVMLGAMLIGILLTATRGNIPVGGLVFLTLLTVGFGVYACWALGANARDRGYRSVMYEHYLRRRVKRVAEAKEVLGIPDED